MVRAYSCSGLVGILIPSDPNSRRCITVAQPSFFSLASEVLCSWNGGVYVLVSKRNDVAAAQVMFDPVYVSQLWILLGVSNQQCKC